MRRPFKNRIFKEYKKMVFNLTLRFYIKIINNRLTLEDIKRYLEYSQ